MKLYFKYSLALIFIVFFLEILIYLKYEHPPKADITYDKDNFEYQYVEIFQNFFNKKNSASGKCEYITQRSRCKRMNFMMPKNKNTKRIFIIGGSVANFFGDYADEFKNMLNYSFPNVNFEIIDCGAGCYDSYRVSLIQKEILRYSPDLIIVFSGNNELHKELGFSYLRLQLIKFNNLLKNTSWIYKYLSKKIIGQHIQDIHMNQRIPTAHDRAKNYKKNLLLMVNRAERKNVPMILCTLPENLRDCPPMGKLPLYDKGFFSAWINYENEDYQAAIKNFINYLNFNENKAISYFYLARSYEMIHDFTKAKEYYLKALEMDSRSGGDRCPPSRNNIIRKIAAEKDVVLVDLEKLFTDISPNKSVGSNYFQDNCHWYSALNYKISEEIIKRITIASENSIIGRIFPTGTIQDGNVLSRKNDFSKKVYLEAQENIFSIFLYGVSQIRHDSISERTICMFSFIHVSKADFFDFNSATVLKEQALGMISGNIWNSYSPDWANVLLHIGETYRRHKLYSQSLIWLNEAVSQNPDLSHCYLIRGLVHYKLGNLDLAKNDFIKIGKNTHAYAVYQHYKEILKLK